MKIIIYAKTDLGKRAIVREFEEFNNWSARDKAEFLKLFKISQDKKNGLLLLQGINPALAYVQPWALTAKIETALALEGALKNIDYRLVLE